MPIESVPLLSCSGNMSASLNRRSVLYPVELSVCVQS
jgi:hypothetical protein